MMIEKDNDLHYYRLRHLMIFTIRDRRGRTIAFGGRAAYFPALKHSDYAEMVSKTNNGETDNYFKISEIVKQKQGVKTFWYPEWEAFWMQQVQDALTKKTSVKDALSASADRARKLARS